MSPAARQQRQTAALKTGIYSAVSAPRLRQRRLRRKVRSLRAAFPHLATAPDLILQRFAEVDLVAATVFVHLIDGEVETEDGAPRRLLSEYRALIRELARLGETLGITGKPPEVDPLKLLLGEP